MMEREELLLSTLPKTWIFDLDGTLVEHNGYKTKGRDILLDGAAEYLKGIPEEDRILIITSRREEYRAQTGKKMGSAMMRSCLTCPWGRGFW